MEQENMTKQDFLLNAKFGTSLHIISSCNIDKVTLLCSTHACRERERDIDRKEEKRRGLIKLI